MATILGLAMKISADATGVQQSLTPVERALMSLQEQADKATAAFKPLARESAAAGAAQEKVAEQFAALTKELEGGLDPRIFAAKFKALQDAAADTAAAFEEGAKITEKYRNEEEKRATQLEKITRLQEQGAISEEIAVRAKEDALGISDALKKAEKERAEAVEDASRIIRANLTPQEKYDDEIQKLTVHLREGRLTQDQFNRASEKASQDLEKAGKAASDADKKLDKLNSNLSFLTKLEIGRAIVDGLQVLSRTFTSTASQITSLVSSVNSSLDTLNDFSNRTGIGVEALQGYSLAAKLAGVDTEAFGMALQKLAINVGKATPGGALDKALRGINLSVAELRALAPEQQFSAIGSAISQLPTAADRAAAAVQIFGKQGAALAPLFKEGADSLEDLRARAERLGAIVSQTQINNVADMNDAFDLVKATVSGITGQVIGNLAPAVTDVANQFLEFVETFNGAEGTGGTGIANRITDVLLQGAEFLAGVFDKFVEQFGGFAVTLQDAAAAFSLAGSVFAAVTDSLRVGFNLFEGAGNALAEGLGIALEGIGSWVSGDLEQVGRDMQEQARKAGDANAKQLREAAQGVANATQNIFTGESGTPGKSGAGAATEYVKGFAEQVARERLPEVRVATNLEKTQKQLEAYFKAAGDGAGEFYKQSQDTLDVFKAQVEQGELLPAQIEMMGKFMDELNEKLQQEANLRKEAAEATEKQIEEDQKRIKELMKPSDAATKIEEDLAAVYREQTRAQEQLAAAREAAANATTEKAAKTARAEADSAAASIASLDQIEAKLKETQQAAGKGFSDGYKKQFEETGKAIETARIKAQSLGTIGVQAAEELARGVAELQDRTSAGFVSKPEYDAELARLQQFFEERLNREQQNQRFVAESKIAANNRVEELLRANLDERTRAEIAAEDAITKRKRTALENVAALQERIDVQQKAVAAARESGDLKSAKARQTELRLLEKTKLSEQQIADGKDSASNRQVQQLQSGFTQAQQFQSLVAKQNETFLRSFANAYEGANATLAATNAAAAEILRQQELMRPVAGPVNTADIRTQEGQALVLSLAANAQDPALIEARLQTKQLQVIAQGISQAASNYFNSPVAIVGGAALA